MAQKRIVSHYFVKKNDNPKFKKGDQIYYKQYVTKPSDITPDALDNIAHVGKNGYVLIDSEGDRICLTKELVDRYYNPYKPTLQ